MKVDLNKKLKDISGKELIDTVGDVLARGLFSGAGVGNTQEEKFAAYKLQHKIMNADGELEFDIDERKLLRSVACASLVPGAFGQVVGLIGEN